MATFDLTRVTASTTGLIDQLKAKLDNLSVVLAYYEDVITDIGVNNDFELGNILYNEIGMMMDNTDILTQRFEQIRYGNLPFPPCFEGTTGPNGWTGCPTGITWN